MGRVTRGLKVSHDALNDAVRLTFAVANKIDATAFDNLADENRNFRCANFDGTDEAR